MVLKQNKYLGLVSVSIVIYKNDINELKLAIDSVLNSEFIHKLYLVDNSPDDSLKVLQQISPKIEYISNPKNPGFGAAHNIAVKLSEKDDVKYHLILNPDVEFKKDVISELFHFMENNENCALVMPKVLYKNGDLQYLCKKLPTPFELFGKRLPFKSLKNFINYDLELRMFNYNEKLNVPYLSGCFMFCKVKPLVSIGGFDELYFMYMEDLDLTRRLHRDFLTIYYPKVYVIHGYRSESKINKKLLFELIFSAFKYYNKFGWFFDAERRRMNKGLLQKINSL